MKLTAFVLPNKFYDNNTVNYSIASYKFQKLEV